MRRILIVVVVAGCGSSKSEPTAAEVQRAYEAAIIAGIKEVTPQATAVVRSTEMQIYASAESCELDRSVIARSTVKVPKGESIACGVADKPPRWRLQEHAGEMVPSATSGSDMEPWVR